jgi:hypothetical protein
VRGTGGCCRTFPVLPSAIRFSPVNVLTQRGLVNRYVGNKIAVFSMQTLGCDVAALNTVQFSGFFHLINLTLSKKGDS